MSSAQLLQTVRPACLGLPIRLCLVLCPPPARRNKTMTDCHSITRYRQVPRHRNDRILLLFHNSFGDPESIPAANVLALLWLCLDRPSPQLEPLSSQSRDTQRGRSTMTAVVRLRQMTQALPEARIFSNLLLTCSSCGLISRFKAERLIKLKSKLNGNKGASSIKGAYCHRH